MNETPQPKTIEVVAGSEVVITWDNDSVSRLTAKSLRAACPCATCRDERGRRQTELVLGGVVPVTINSASLVGGYAVSFVFGPDGHGTGIYPFEALYGLEAPGPSS